MDMNYIKDNRHQHFDEEKGKIWEGPFFFIQGSDTQFGMMASFPDLQTIPGWEEEKRLACLSVEKINSMRPRPKFFVICGDLCDAIPGSNNYEAQRKEQERDFIEIYNKIDKSIPVVCVCGNHDVGNQPTTSTVKRYRSVFGQDYYSFWSGGILFLVINSQYYFDGSQIPDMVKSQQDWLEGQLKNSSKSKFGPVVFQHIPYFLTNPEETDSGYFALDLFTRKPLLERLYEAEACNCCIIHQAYAQNGRSVLKSSNMRVVKVGCLPAHGGFLLNIPFNIWQNNEETLVLLKIIGFTCHCGICDSISPRETIVSEEVTINQEKSSNITHAEEHKPSKGSGTQEKMQSIRTQ